MSAAVSDPGARPWPELRNGLPIVVRARPGAEVATVSVWVLFGSRHEVSPGVTHLLEHVLMQAVPAGHRMRVADELESLGAEANAVTARDHLALHARVPTPEALPTLRVLADGLANTDFPAELVDAERRVVDEELRLATADPNDIVHDVFFATAFAGQQMGAPVGGTRAGVAALTPADLAAWTHRNVRAGTVGVVVSGDVEATDVAAALDDGPLGALPSSSAPGEVRPRPTHGRTDLALNSDTSAVIVGGHGFALDHPLLPAAEVLIELLAGGNAAVLYEEIRSRRGLTYDLWGVTTGYRDAGVWRIGMSTAAEHRDTVAELARTLILDAVSTGFSVADVATARRRVAALARLDAESSLDEVLLLGQHRLVGRDPGWSPRRHAEALLRVEPADVAECARLMLRRLVVATAGGSTRHAVTDVDRRDREEGIWNATLSAVAGPR
jgi:predicted Zn-dependent peptidase